MKRYTNKIVVILYGDAWLDELHMAGQDGFRIIGVIPEGESIMPTVFLEREEESAPEPAPADDGWISVSERLPEAMVPVLGIYGVSMAVVVLWPHGRWCFQPLANPPTHWRSLPAPPQETGS